MAAAEAVDTGAGALFIVKNYEGDVMNFDMAREMAGRNIETVITDDDVAVENSLYTTGRRGVAGTLVVEKVVGAAAEQGADLTTLKALGDRVNKATRSMGVALTSCTVPAAGKPTFQIGENEMEMGVGIHGEPGRRRVALRSADDIAEEMVAAIAGDLGARGDALLFVNGFGGTPAMELYLMYNAAVKQLAKHGIRPARSLVGSYVTSLDMAGCSITVTMLDDAIARAGMRRCIRRHCAGGCEAGRDARLGLAKRGLIRPVGHLLPFRFAQRAKAQAVRAPSISVSAHVVLGAFCRGAAMGEGARQGG